MIADDRVWTVRFRREIADELRQRAAAEQKTVQQVIIAAVEGLLKAASDSASIGLDVKEPDTYQYGGGQRTV